MDVGAFAPGPRAAPAVPTFVCVASLREYKGHAVLLDALRLLHARGSNVKVVLVGDGELRGTLAARIAREGLGDRVELRGALPHEEIPAVLRAATAMVLPSVTSRDGQMEGIPVALMEAMAALFAGIAPGRPRQRAAPAAHASPVRPIPRSDAVRDPAPHAGR